MKTHVFCGLLAGLISLNTWAAESAIKIENAWVRATAPGQNVAGAFMDITAPRDMRLISGESPASKVVELHTMRMDNGVMIMRQVKEITLPAGKTVNLKPGGLHVMLIDLNGPIAAGSKTPVTLVVKDKQGKETRVAVEVEARAPGSMGQMPPSQ